MNDNLSNIKRFFNSPESKMLINSISVEVALLYKFLIEHYGKINNFGLHDDVVSDQNDIFNSKKRIYIVETNSNKKIIENLRRKDKIVFFTNYSNFKKINDVDIKINSYKYKDDVICHFREINYINEDLISFIADNPTYIYSEILKFEVMNINYKNDIYDRPSENLIYKIRKEFFEKKDIRLLYNLIKKEVHYKKFNFLTY